MTHAHYALINRTNKQICEVCEEMHNFLAKKFGVDGDNPSRAEQQIEDMDFAEGPQDDDLELFLLWKSLRSVLLMDVPDECI